MALNVAETWRSPAVEKGLALDCDVDADAPQQLIGDAQRIRQVVAKITSNAVKYTHSGSVRIQARVQIESDQDCALDAPDACLEISICDTGPGITKIAGEKIFDAFEQAESGSLRSQDGAGLGLAICQSLAKLMGGGVHFDTTLGQGTTFYIRIPIEVVQASVEAVVEAETELALVQGKRILVVEDNMINRMVAVRLLEGLGLECETAENGALCLESVQEQPFDIILMDNHMPVMDGVEAMRKIRSMDAPLSGLPIVACTADDMSGARESLLQAGFDEFLAKPINSDGLHDAMVRALRSVSGRKSLSDVEKQNVA